VAAAEMIAAKFSGGRLEWKSASSERGRAIKRKRDGMERRGGQQGSITSEPEAIWVLSKISS